MARQLGVFHLADIMDACEMGPGTDLTNNPPAGPPLCAALGFGFAAP